MSSYTVWTPAPFPAKLIGVLLWGGYVAAGAVASARAVGRKEQNELWPIAVAGAGVGCVGMSVHAFWQGNATVGQCVVAPVIGGLVSAGFYALSDYTQVADFGDGSKVFLTVMFSSFLGLLPAKLMKLKA